MSDELTGASAMDQALYRHLSTHVEQEKGLLEEYVQAAAGTESKAMAYVVNLLIEDEQRHHRLFAELASSLKADVECSGDPVVPRMDFDRSNRTTVAEVTERLLQREEGDARELKRLQRELSVFKDTTLWGLLVELMERDTDKHIALLRFVRRHVKRPSA
jgi:hypothetical protein